MLSEDDIASMRASITDPQGIWAKDPARQADELQKFEARISAGRASGALGPAPQPYDEKAAAEEQIASMFPGGPDPIAEGLRELIDRASDSVKDMSEMQLRNMGEWNAKQIEETDEAVYEADGTTFKRWRTIPGAEQLDRLVASAGAVTPTEKAKLRATPLPALRILASVGQRNTKLMEERKKRGI
jgi:hypothetical protein